MDREIAAEDIVVSMGMIEAGLAVLEETDDRPLSRLTVERAFQQMCLRSLQESALSSYAPIGLRNPNQGTGANLFRQLPCHVLEVRHIRSLNSPS